MAERFDSLSEAHQRFIEAQKIFFVATAARDGRVNLSPKGHEALKVLGPNEILWLNLTGSGNETAAHVQDINRITLMWCAFEGPPRILRVYGTAAIIHPRDEAWKSCAEALPPLTGARQYIRIKIDLVQTSCGYAVPLFDYQGERPILLDWAERKGEDGLAAYWEEKNTKSLDGLPTGIVGD
ncbi:pyridoxamine 5'-phosphate oxidase family protein [Tepidicaulis sp. LMO-SS28]|uniref:pyridoxamine 5'-phosphate oxidase family protein n=1 Tax=Tepidicaulis sp. LMO-SS28 TaxID=3447455 RepID=UPI003EE1C969